MPTGHLNPGYHDIISKLNRVKSGIQLNSDLLNNDSLPGIDNSALDEIRRNARDAWSKQHSFCPTTYGEHFNRNKLPYTETLNIESIRPYSFEHRNRPHPSREFLVTTLHQAPGDRMHYIPGLHNPDATVGKPAYQLDASQPMSEQYRRTVQREKFIGRPATAAVRQYMDNDNLTMPIMPNIPYGNEASEEDDSGPKCIHDNNTYRSHSRVNTGRVRRPHTIPVMSGVSRGAEDLTEAYKYLNQLNGDCYSADRQRVPITTDIVTRKSSDIERTRLVRADPRNYIPKRGDFTIHPQWPPTIVHHRLNGLSSVDMPYMPGRR